MGYVIYKIILVQKKIAENISAIDKRDFDLYPELCPEFGILKQLSCPSAVDSFVGGMPLRIRRYEAVSPG